MMPECLLIQRYTGRDRMVSCCLTGQSPLIGDKDVPLVILGDPPYPLLSWLMKAFPDNGRLSREQKTFTTD